MLKFVSLKTHRVYKTSHSVDEINDRRRSNIEEEDEEEEEEENGKTHESYCNFNGSQQQDGSDSPRKTRRSLSLDDLRDRGGIDNDEDVDNDDVVGIGNLIMKSNCAGVGSYSFGDEDDDGSDVLEHGDSPSSTEPRKSNTYGSTETNGFHIDPSREAKGFGTYLNLEAKVSAPILKARSSNSESKTRTKYSDPGPMMKSKSLENIVGGGNSRELDAVDFADTYLKDSRRSKDEQHLIINDAGGDNDQEQDFEKRLYSYLSQQDSGDQQHQQQHLLLQHNNSNDSYSSSTSGKSSRKSSPDMSFSKHDVNDSFAKYNTINTGSMSMHQYNTLKHMVSMFKPKTNNKPAGGDEYRVSLIHI